METAEGAEDTEVRGGSCSPSAMFWWKSRWGQRDPPCGKGAALGRVPRWERQVSAQPGESG